MKRLSLTLCGLLLLSGWFVLPGQVIDYRTVVRIDNGKRITERALLIQINNKDQEGLTEIEIPYSAEQDLVLLEAAVIAPGGRLVRELKKKEITTRSNISHSSFYEDDYVQAFRLNWHEYPYQIRYSYRLTEKDFLYVVRWQPVLYAKVPTISASLQIEVPAGYPVAMDYPLNLEYHATVEAGKEIHRWQISDYRAPAPELFAPPFLEQVPVVTVVPLDFEYAIPGSLASWADYGNWHEKLNESLDELPSAEGRQVDALIQGMTDQREIIRTLYHYLQDHTRYINVAIDVGGLKPYPAAYVCEKKYGDCKALTIYMKALLKRAGIPSHYVVIHAGDNPVRIRQQLPGQQFNHVILGVQLAGDTVWLENTAGYLPYNYLGTFTQNRPALWVDGTDSRLVRTPALELDDVREHSIYHFRLDEHGRAQVELKRRLRGDAFEQVRYRQREQGTRALEQKIVDDLPLPSPKLIRLHIVPSDRDQPELEMELTLEAGDQLRKVGSLLALQPPPVRLPDFEKPAERKLPVRINFPINQQDELIYELPFMAHYQVELPAAVSIETPFGRYTEAYERDAERIVLTRQFQLFRVDCEPARYPEFYAFIAAVREAQKQSVVVFSPKD